MRPWCLLFVSALAFAPTVPRAEEPPRPAEPQLKFESQERQIALYRLHSVGKRLFDAGDYQSALVMFSTWEMRASCGIGASAYAAEKPYRLALCHAHLNEHDTAARLCLHAASQEYWGCDDQWGVLLIQLYREAGQLDDLPPLLEAIDRAALTNHRAAGDTPEVARPHVTSACFGTNLVRRLLKVDELAKLAPWPAAMPKPKPGSLPKAL